jgi:hypothetical protein
MLQNPPQASWKISKVLQFERFLAGIALGIEGCEKQGQSEDEHVMAKRRLRRSNRDCN